MGDLALDTPGYFDVVGCDCWLVSRKVVTVLLWVLGIGGAFALPALPAVWVTALVLRKVSERGGVGENWERREQYRTWAHRLLAGSFLPLIWQIYSLGWAAGWDWARHFSVSDLISLLE